MARFVSIIISGNAKPLNTALAKATANMTDFQKKVATGFIVAGAAATAFAAAAVKAAAKDQVVMKNLERQLRASAGATAEQVHQSEQFLKSAGRASAFGKTALIPGYQSLVLATKDVSKAQAIMNVALDTARARNLDVTTVAEALAKAYAGNTRGLRNLSPEMKKLIADGATFSDVLTVLGKNFSGAASDYAKTFQGRLDILNNTTAALKKQIGYALLPVVERLIPVFQTAADVMMKHPRLITAIAIGIGTLAAAFMAATTAVIAWKVAAQTAALLNAALATSFTTLQVATGGILLAVSALAAAYIHLSGSTSGAAKSTREFSDELFKTGDGQKVAIAQLVKSQKAFENLAKILNMAGVGQNAFTDYINKGGGALEQLKGRIDAAVKANRELVFFNTQGQGFTVPAKDAKVYQKALEDLLKAQKDYKTQQELLNMLGLGDQSERMKAAEEARAKALEKTKKALADARKAVTDYAKSIRDALVGMVSLQDAFSTAQAAQDDATSGLNDALKERADAYDKLNRLERDRWANARDLAQAQEDVAAAEDKVNKARQVTAPNYTALFKKQIEDAKKFGGLLKQLRQMNLSDAAVQQILALGPVAGAQVAADLLSGAAGMTVGSLNADIAAVGAAGYAAGVAGPGEAGILSGTRVGGSGGTYSIYVTSADPKAVVEALKTYMRQNGAVPIKVTNK